jgi:hypothetical protein
VVWLAFLAAPSRVLRVSMVNIFGSSFTTETQRTQRLHRENKLGPEKGSVRGALRPGVVIGAKCCGGRKWLRKEPNVIAPRRVKKYAL